MAFGCVVCPAAPAAKFALSRMGLAVVRALVLCRAFAGDPGRFLDALRLRHRCSGFVLGFGAFRRSRVTRGSCWKFPSALPTVCCGFAFVVDVCA